MKDCCSGDVGSIKEVMVGISRCSRREVQSDRQKNTHLYSWGEKLKVEQLGTFFAYLTRLYKIKQYGESAPIPYERRSSLWCMAWELNKTDRFDRRHSDIYLHTHYSDSKNCRRYKKCSKKGRRYTMSYSSELRALCRSGTRVSKHESS